MVRIGAFLDGALSELAYKADLLSASEREPGSQPTRDLDQVRSFLLSGGPVALMDLPWIPLYAGLCFLFHPWIGYAVLIGAGLLVVPTIMTEVLTRMASRRTTEFAAKRYALSETSRRNAEVLVATGMTKAMLGRWSKLNASYVKNQQRSADVTGGFGAITKAMRMGLQSAVLGIGALLVINGEATAGIIIASSILAARALAPVEQAIGHWRGFVAARQGAGRLSRSLELVAADERYTTLPPPKSSLAAEGVSVMPPSGNQLVVDNVTFSLRAGQGLGIVGPSASGKSSLVRALVGVWKPARGKVRIDGAAIEHWSPEARNQYVGYLPQDVELFSGTVAENITRFEGEPDDAAMIEAAKAASVHELILRLPEGYQTQIGDNGAVLSSGQRQRIALARALYRNPFIVVLDEPNSNLDQEGDAALTTALLGIRGRGGIAVVVAHRPSALASVDTLMVMRDGTAQMIGPKDAILDKICQVANPARPVPLRSAPLAGGTK
jgi:ATP-binding cassette subfamily C protein